LLLGEEMKPAAATIEPQNLYPLRLRDLIRYLRQEEIAFLLVFIYLFLEYVRPQTIYPAIDVLPYSFLVIVTGMLAVIFGQHRYVPNAVNGLMFLFLLVILFSSLFAMAPEIAFSHMAEFGGWFLVYFLIIHLVNSESRFLIFMFSFLLYSFKMSQFAFRGWASIGFSYSDWGTGGGPGWFHNSGEFGIQMCVALPLSLYFIFALREHWPKWKLALFALLPFTAVTGMISSSSRGALVGGAAVLLWMTMRSRYKFKAAVALVVVGIGIILALPPEQMERFEESGEDRTSISRIERWNKGLDMASRYPVLGVGYFNWSLADQTYYGGDGQLSHNIYIQALSELGYVGLAVFMLLILYTFINNHQTRKLAAARGQNFIFQMAHGLDAALVGFLVSGFFVTVLYYPYFWINLAMTVALRHIAGREGELLPDAQRSRY
jgi:putative inorganic carbon (hco3(-)) transporter